MRRHQTLARALVPALMLAGLVVFSPTASAARANHHCVVEVVGQEPDGEFVTAPARCFPTFAAAMEAAGFDTSGLEAVNPETMAGAGRFAASVDSIIGIHYDGASWTGASFTVVGSGCFGGWLNLSASWINRVSSTQNGCNQIIHFDGYNLTGASQSTFGFGGNLIGLNNRANSIQYAT